ncbi:MAG: RNA polymerase factor sigma-54 [Cocleimonas sp.]
MIKQGLNIKLGQSLSMTPQLQQAIRLLQLSSVELEQEVQEILDTNPLLERQSEESPHEENNICKADDIEPSSDTIPEDLNIDANWDDIYDPEWKVTNSDTSTSTSDFIETMHSESQGLHEHLIWQVELGNLSDLDKEIARLIIDYIADDGYLKESLEQIHESLKDTLFIDFDEVEAVLTYIQHLSPSGVGARSLDECLLLQLKQHHLGHPLYKRSHRLLEKHLDLLKKRDYTGIKRALRVNDTILEELIQLIRSLEPEPGSAFNTSSTDYIVPDVYVKKIKGKWTITLNGSTQQELKLNNYYVDMLKNTTQKETSQYIKENLQQARWFISSLENRNDTILRVAQAIVEKQQAFFQYGEEAMKPLVLSDLATQLNVHESTVSRVTTRKFMHTPRGVYEFKFFFSSHVSTDTGGECSSTAIRAMIKNLINQENPTKPLSDNKLTNLLNQQGIKVARRTVAKYREAQAIPSSHDRKVFA